ncbi:MAG: radical SAM protein [Chlorobi bacterium]|nr:radical SAM protein [Chlorobiota bacterium]
MEIFGPVPSRRLGISLGINNIPHKVCSYSCLYCQVGKGDRIQVERQKFYEPDYLVEKVREALKGITDEKMYPDYLTIVPDGEPTLDVNLGVLIEWLKEFGIPVAVITNSTLLPDEQVRAELMKADWVSVKCDTFNENIWHKLNIPHRSLKLPDILNGIRIFAGEFKGKLVTETMLLKSVNDSDADLRNTADIISTFKPETSFISIPTRPTAFRKAERPEEQTLAMAYGIFSQELKNVELLTGYEGNAFASTGNFRDDILSITAVHPLREDAVMELMKRSNGTEKELTEMIESKQIEKTEYNGEYFYLRKFKRN